MLYGRRLDQALEHVDGSRYALVHAVSKRARQITLWLTADPAELRVESAPPPTAGELITRDPVALAEAEILQGEVRVHWDPLVRGEEFVEVSTSVDPMDEMLLETLGDDDDEADLAADEDGELTPALAQVLEGEAAAEEDSDEDEESSDDDLIGDDTVDVSLDEMGEAEAAEAEDEDEV